LEEFIGCNTSETCRRLFAGWQKTVVARVTQF
jgi:hypothetical protein